MKKKVIVVGGGFAGIQLARNLDKDIFDVLLIDKINHHQFQPLFYQVATSQIEPSNISFPFRHIFKNEKNMQIRLAEVINIDTINNKIKTTIGDFDYDSLVIAIGCKTNFFGNNDICEHSFTLKTTYDAIKIRNHILQTFEDIISANGAKKESLLNLIIVGAGATGVELAGAFAEIKKEILPRDYPRIDFTKFKITLIEGTKNTLNNMSDMAKAASRKYLEKMGVEMLTETFVTGYDGNTLKLNNGNEINTKTVIWTAGVIGNTLPGLPNSAITFGNRLKVNRINKVDETKILLKHPFDFIFFTGSTAVGKIISRAASENLTPVALELGGKSPAIIEKDANIKMAAKRIVWGKFLNSGQTCVAPDYLLVHQSIKDEIISEIKNQIKLIHGANQIDSEAFVRIINPRHFQRLINLIDNEKLIIGGETCENELYIAPTILDNISFDDEVMKEEIFGPILPIITYTDLDWAIDQIKAKPKPLALYLFSNSTQTQKKILQEISFGGGAINDVIMHLANSKLPFGGVGHSGMGNYHGKFGFDAFSHKKSIIKKTNWFEPWFKYPPYTKGKLELIRKILG